MKKSFFIFLFFSLMLFHLTGCVFILGGAAGVIGAYGLSKDTIEGDTDTSYEDLWSAALIVSKARGTVTREDRLLGSIALEAEATRVWVQVMSVTEYTSRLRVSARRYHFPNLPLAQDIYLKIIEQARRTPLTK